MKKKSTKRPARAKASTIEFVVNPTGSRSRKLKICARIEGDDLETDVIDVFAARPRRGFLAALRAKATDRNHPIESDPVLERQLMAAVAQFTSQAVSKAGGTSGPAYISVDGTDSSSPVGLYRHGEVPYRLCNFTATIHRDSECRSHGQGRSSRQFTGTVRVEVSTAPSEWAISAAEFADDRKLLTSLLSAGGAKLQTFAPVGEIRTAISFVSDCVLELTTTQIGWIDNDTYVAPGVRITRDGVVCPSDGLICVPVSEEPWVRRFRLKTIEPVRLEQVRLHVLNELPNILSSLFVFWASLSFALLPPLIRWINLQQRPTLWIVGRSGLGKSAFAQLLQAFYADFLSADSPDKPPTFNSTINALERHAALAGESLVLLDDYKPTRGNSAEVARLIHAIADGAPRVRLRSDATSDSVPAIRGLALATGEDIPQHSASALSRSIVLDITEQRTNVGLLETCRAMSVDYPMLTGYYIHHLLVSGAAATAADRFRRHLDVLQPRFPRSDMSMRTANNLALLATSFDSILVLICGFAFNGPDWTAQMNWFADELAEVGLKMIERADSQDEAVIFVQTLAASLAAGRVCCDGVSRQGEHPGKPIVGRMEPDGRTVSINLNEALREVNQSLVNQSHDPIPVSHRKLISALVARGWALDPVTSQPLPANAPGNRTKACQVGGHLLRCVLLNADLLFPGRSRAD